MSHDQGHRSSAGPGSAGRDRRVSDLVDRAHSNNLLNQAGKAFAADPHRGLGLESFTHNNRRPLQTGIVVYALPFANWYKVQVDGTGASIACCLGDAGGGFLPMGSKSTAMIQPNATVVLWQPPGRLYGVILAALPTPHHDARLVNPDWISQGSQSGAKRESAYKAPFKLMYREGGVTDFEANRPYDQTMFDWGRICETGVGIHVDPFMSFLRAGEMCGVWVNFFDQHLRLAGLQLDIQNTSFEITAREDEGENRHVTYFNPYPWETLGLYSPGEDTTNVFDSADVQYKIAKAKRDQPDGQEDLQSISRIHQYGGYLGQGGYRLVNIPAKDSGKRFFKDSALTAPDMGVFEESVGLDGTWAVRSAKQIFITKRCLIPVPKEMRLPEDQKTGDDSRQGNYKFSGRFGEGDAHKVGDVAVAGDDQQLRRAAGVSDLLAYAYNWQSKHPFHYHKQDYQLPNESQLQAKSGTPRRVQEVLPFDSLATRTYMADPTPSAVKVDDRYGTVDYYQRESGMALLPDGGVVLFSGDGVQISMVGGRLRIDAPGGIDICPGTSFNVIAGDDVNIRAKNSVDITAGSKDLRLKAQNNLQVLSNTGGILIESKASGFTADFQNKVGEDVSAGGIMLKAGRSQIVNWAGDMYFRTGTDDGGGANTGGLKRGRIVFDADKGKQPIIFKAAAVQAFVRDGLSCWVGTSDENSNVQASYIFGAANCVLGKSTTIDGPLSVLGDAIFSGGCVNFSGYSSVTNNQGIGRMNRDEFGRNISDIRSGALTVKTTGTDAHTSIFNSALYAPAQPGHDPTIRFAQFSYRDDGQGLQYATTQFKLVESRWQMMARLGLGSGGTPWAEPTVTYQGRVQLPYPGKAKWEDEATLHRLKELTIFDAATGVSKDRPYESPALAAWETVTPKEGFKTIGS